MTAAQAAYRAGAIAAELDERFGLTPAALGNASRTPGRLHVVCRHVWERGLAAPEVLDLLDGFDPPAGPYAAAEQGAFWVGYYHQKAARDLPPDFGPRLASLRERAGLSQSQLAAAAGLSRQVVHNYENGRRPTWDAVQALAAALGVPTDTFRDNH